LANQLYNESGDAYDTAVMSVDEMNQAKAEARQHPLSGHPEAF
jgi:hypothetical protein